MKCTVAALFGLLVASTAFGQFGPGNIVISQLYGGGGNVGATYQNDYVELLNRTAAPISISGWSLQYTSAAGSSWSTNLFALPSATIPAGSYFLVQMASTNPVGSVLPTPDAISTINMSATTGKIALVTNTTALTGTNP